MEKTHEIVNAVNGKHVSYDESNVIARGTYEQCLHLIDRMKSKASHRHQLPVHTPTFLSIREIETGKWVY